MIMENTILLFIYNREYKKNTGKQYLKQYILLYCGIILGKIILLFKIEMI